MKVFQSILFIMFLGILILTICAVNVQGLNLFTWDKLKKYDVDPETNTGGDWYPIQRVFNLGVDVTF